MRASPALLALLFASPLLAGDWPMWGRDPSRNMVAPADEKNLPTDLSIEPNAPNLKWSARLGTASYGNPVAARGRVLVGTNNEPPHDKRLPNDRAVLLCLDESTGKLLWQLAIPKLGDPDQDFEGAGLACSPTIDPAADRVYLVTNRCEVLCLDLQGLSNGNDGPFTDEAHYLADADHPPIKLAATDADILWRYDMRKELGVAPLFQTAGSVLIVGDRLYLSTCNGHDPQITRPAPDAPQLICLDKTTGKLLGQERSDISKRLYYGNWSSPSYGEVDLSNPPPPTNGSPAAPPRDHSASTPKQPAIFFGAGDGFCYAFDPTPTPEGTLKEIWRFDCNPPDHKTTPQGKPYKYQSSKGPSEIIATPVFHNNRVYVAVGQEPAGGDGIGCLNCIDPTQSGDVSKTAKLWSNPTIGHSLSTAAVTDDGLLFLPELSGKFYCFDANTGQILWDHDTGSETWGSFLVADAKAYVANKSGTLTIFSATRDKKLLAEVAFNGEIYSTPIVANGTLYVCTDKYLHAFSANHPK